MKKAISLLLTSAILITTGCSLSSRKKKPTDSSFKTAEQFADYFCGPCKEVDMETVEGFSGEIEIHYMQDEEYGFVYQVEVSYPEASKSYHNPSYLVCDFEYFYMQEFFNETDYSELIDKYDLTIEIDEHKLTKVEGLYAPYTPHIKFYTDLELTKEETDEIMEFTYNSLKAFDKRDYYFNELETIVFFAVYCAPNEKERERGLKYGGDSGSYGSNYS